jgi:hypothetical protein
MIVLFFLEFSFKAGRVLDFVKGFKRNLIFRQMFRPGSVFWA